jgi:hypothetical protein
MPSRTIRLWLLALPQLWLAHAITFFLHEYAHSFAAWALQCKANPFVLHYGHLTVANLLVQSEIDELVDYTAIFRAGHGVVAALIAVSGVLLGNGLSYIFIRRLFNRYRRKHSAAWAMFFFFLCLMSVGNFLDSVPVRTFADHSDMATTARGFHTSPWTVVVVLGLPFALALRHFFARILLSSESLLFPWSYANRCLLVVLSCFLIFVFFGSAGLSGYGATSHWLSMTSIFACFPLAMVLCWPRRGRITLVKSSGTSPVNL